MMLALLLTLGVEGAHAQLDSSLSAPVSDPFSPSLYSESLTNGPSSSLLPGGTNLLNPSLRSGISDPLGFLIETGNMSPFLPGDGMAPAYPQTQVESQVLNDPFLALRTGEYRNNRLLMAGAGPSNALAARTTGSVSTFAASAGARVGAAGGTDRGNGMLRPFAAGSSLLASQSAAGQGGFVDPNAILAAARTSPSSLDEYTSNAQGGSAGGTFSSSDPGVGGLSGGGMEGGAMETMAVPSIATASGLIGDSGADAMPLGAAAGQMFPNFSMATQADSGFPDSTMGTAGLAESRDFSGASPLLWPRANSESSPFPEMSGESTDFLHPSLRGHAAIAPSRPRMSVEEAARIMRRQMMARDPQAQMPSAFAQRAMIRNFEKQQASGAKSQRSRAGSRFSDQAKGGRH